MGILDNLANRIGYVKQPSLVGTSQYALYAPVKTHVPEKPEEWLTRTASGEKWSIPDPTNASVQADLYRKLSWIQTAVGAVSRFCATVPFMVKVENAERLDDVANHPFEQLLRKPNPLQSRMELLEWTFSYLQLTGNAYLWLNRSDATGAPLEIWVLPSHQVEPVPDGRMFLRGYLYDPLDGGPKVALEPWEIIHFRLFNPHSWFIGMSPLEALNQVAQGDLAQQRWNTNLFAANNAKMPGGLAFADPIDNATWAQMREEIREGWGGVNRNGPMMLRNVGAGGVSWVQMAMSHSDMEFLQGRAFTKEEIFSVYAPGLASVIAINATEANAKAGQNTFRELAVWPRLTLFAEKITNDLLGAYGDGLVGTFEDVRIRDRAMELAETQEFAKAHTVNEVREKAGSKPLADERGELFIVQINATSGGIQESVIPAGLAAREPAKPEQDKPEDIEDTGDTEEDKRAERKALKKWLRKPGRDIHDFKARYLTHDELHAIAKEADTEQPPFVLPTGGITPEAYKAMVLLLDPDDDEGEQRIANALISQVEESLDRGLTAWLREVFPSGSEAEIADWERRLISGEAKFRDVLARALQQGTDLGVSVAFDQLGGIGMAFDYTLVNTQARQWASEYVGQLITRITDTTRAAVRQSVAAWIDTGQPLTALTRSLAPTFGRQRAKLIAATEVTSAYANGSELGYIASGVVSQFEIRTAQDERVCPICSQRAGQRYPLGSANKPPFHPGCRCAIAPVIE